jgi:2-hydroxy-3-oxopropionate reductase
MIKHIGFIGMGIMGKPMALNLLKAGYQLSVCSTNAETLMVFKSAGATLMNSPKEVAQVSDVVITMLPDSPEVKSIVLGENGIANGLSAGKLYIDMSTIAVAAVLAIAGVLKEKGIETIDAPVSGGQIGAEAQTLSIMAGGSIEAFNRALPIFEVLGKKISHMGDTGTGQATKACNQIATALATQGVIEALTLAKKSGVNLEKMRDALLGGFAQSRALELVGRKIIDRNFAPGFKVKLYRKDLRLALEASTSLSLTLPGTDLVANEMDALLANDKGELDFSALIQVLEN